MIAVVMSKKLKVSVGFKCVDKSTLERRLHQNIENKNLPLKFISDSQFHLLICFLNCIVICNNFCHSVLCYRNPFIDFEMGSSIKPHNEEPQDWFIQRQLYQSVFTELYSAVSDLKLLRPTVIWLSTKSIPKWWKSALGSKEHLWYG